MAGEAAAQTEQQPVVFASRPGLELAWPHCERGIGNVISSLSSAELIHGVELASLSVWPDDRGFFLEVQRFGNGLARRFPVESTQVSAALNYPGSIKAFHYHLNQTDCWTPFKGMLQIALIDLRRGSPTFGRRNTLYCGPLRPWQILIPPGVAHGYKVIGGEEAILVYLTDRFYNPADEGRITYNDARLNYDWETQHK